MIRCQTSQTRLLRIRKRRNAIEDKAQRLKWFLKFNQQEAIADLDLTIEELDKVIAKLDQEKEKLTQEHSIGLREHHELFHPIWGR